MKQPWPPAVATKQINALAGRDECFMAWTGHARERLKERNLLAGDIFYILRRGSVYTQPEKSTRDDLFKYAIEATSPNSEGRAIRVVVIPDPDAYRGAGCLKIITVMWLDEM